MTRTPIHALLSLVPCNIRRCRYIPNESWRDWLHNRQVSISLVKSWYHKKGWESWDWEGEIEKAGENEREKGGSYKWRMVRENNRCKPITILCTVFYIKRYELALTCYSKSMQVHLLVHPGSIALCWLVGTISEVGSSSQHADELFLKKENGKIGF